MLYIYIWVVWLVWVIWVILDVVSNPYIPRISSCTFGVFPGENGDFADIFPNRNGHVDHGLSKTRDGKPWI